jgi:hypothetical protein
MVMLRLCLSISLKEAVIHLYIRTNVPSSVYSSNPGLKTGVNQRSIFMGFSPDLFFIPTTLPVLAGVLQKFAIQYFYAVVGVVCGPAALQNTNDINYRKAQPYSFTICS